VPEAARALGISERAVRKRITAGTLAAEKAGPAWVVALPAGTGAVPGAVPGAGVAEPAVPGAAQGAGAGGTDLAPLADLIERQGEAIQRLTEAATAWQFRALRAEGQLKALEAGPIPPSPDRTGPDAPRTPPASPFAGLPPEEVLADSAKTSSSSAITSALGWRRWWRRVTAG